MCAPTPKIDAISVSSNGATASLQLRDGLWLSFKTPKGEANYNLEYLIEVANGGRTAFGNKETIVSRVTHDFFDRIKHE
jgi:hypothetical protein